MFRFIIYEAFHYLSVANNDKRNKRPCSGGQRCFIIGKITLLHCIFNSYIIIINTHFYHKESKETFNIANEKTNYLL